MAKPIYEVLNADGMSLTIFCGGTSNVGIRLFGTWAGTAKFYASANGVAFKEVFATPFASGTNVSSATANGNWFIPTGGWVAVRVTFTRTSGSLGVALAAAVDSSWQDAFLAASTLFVNSVSGSITQTAQANRAWNLQELSVSLSGPHPGPGSINIAIWDGTPADTLLHKEFLASPTGSTGSQFTISLPSISDGGLPGIVGTPGNAMTIQVVGLPSGLTSSLNAKFSAA